MTYIWNIKFRENRIFRQIRHDFKRNLNYAHLIAAVGDKRKNVRSEIKRDFLTRTGKVGFIKREIVTIGQKLNYRTLIGGHTIAF